MLIAAAYLIFYILIIWKINLKSYYFCFQYTLSERKVQNCTF